MKPRERVEAAISLDIADRPPVGVWGHDYLREWSPRDLADAHIRAQRRLGWDFVKFQPRATCLGAAFGSEFRPSGDPHQFPVLVRPGVQDPADLGLIGAVAATVAPLADQVKGVELVAAAVSPDVPVLQTVSVPSAWPTSFSPASPRQSSQ